jgi:GTP:adenosylcobinamide-phosphate guanylyltransferase
LIDILPEDYVFSNKKRGKRPINVYNAVILAGDKRASRKVGGMGNKTLLTIKGRPIISYVLSALVGSKYVRDIWIVGPKEKIEKAIKHDLAKIKDRKVVILEQWDNIIENAWNGFLYTIDGYNEDVDPDSYLNTPLDEWAALGLSGDIPLLTSYEIDEFLENAQPDKYDYIAGITPDYSLRPYYPKGKKLGIKHSYFHARDIKWRQNNLHLGKMFKIRNKVFINKIYEYRHQREWKNIIKIAINLIRAEKGAYKAIYLLLVLQTCMFLTNRGFGWFSDRLRRLITLSDVEKNVGAILGTRAVTAMTNYGGAALDIDNDEEFEAIKANFDDWMAYQRELFNSKKGDSKKGK